MKKLLISGMLCIAPVASAQEVHEIIRFADVQLWEEFSHREQQSFLIGWILAQEAIRTEFSNMEEVYEMISDYVSDYDETVAWMQSHVNEIYEDPEHRDYPLGVVVQLRHGLINRIRERRR